jgi:hypothetical protein
MKYQKEKHEAVREVMLLTRQTHSAVLVSVCLTSCIQAVYVHNAGDFMLQIFSF